MEAALAHDVRRVSMGSLLRTIEDWYGLEPLGVAAQRQPLTLT